MTARKLTLLIDEALIARAKRVARLRGQSVSLLVSEQLSLLKSAQKGVTRSLRRFMRNC